MLLRHVGGFVLLASTLAAAPTFTKDVAPILYQHCANCHRPGEIGPMPLLTYEQARPWAKAIRGAVALGKMPPWHATQERGVFANDRRLSDRDRETLIAWVEGGAPQGDPADLPPAPKFAEGWQIGAPDAVVAMQTAYKVPAEGTIAYQYVQIPTNFTEDKWVQAIEARPGARAVVHHILVFCREPGNAASPPAFKLIEPNMPRLLSSGDAMRGPLIATYAPGTNALTFPAGSALKIKAGSVLTLQLHYTASGKAAEDVSRVGFIFAKEPPRQEMHTSAFYNPTFTLPAGDPDKAVESMIEFTEDAHVWALFPHTHLRGKSWKYRIVYPDGRSEPILSVPKYDFNWQTYYEFAKPLAAPKGSRIEATAHYDNSPNNPANPNPKIDVRWGEQTWEEMQYSGISYTIDETAPLPTDRRPAEIRQ
ncbi:MAG TPA: hypothetical protein VKX39_08430 [Bryobacteraceae bacterium]|jgi:hypothetical protein|nr:hypothetical protein [Bryobacteraceae bacterium]